MIKTIAEYEFKNYVLDSGNKLVMVVFTTTWCKNCQDMQPIYERVSRKFFMEMNTVQIDADDERGLFNRMGVRSVPTVVFFKNGVPITQYTTVGKLSEESLSGIIVNVLSGK